MKIPNLRSPRLLGRRNILNILQGGITADQLARMQNGQVPGQENGAFAGQHLTASTLQALAALLSQADPNGLFQLPGQAQVPQFQYQPRPPAPQGNHFGFQNPHNPHFQPGGGGGPMLPPGLGGQPHHPQQHPLHIYPGGGGGQHLQGGPIIAPGMGHAPPPPRPKGPQQFYPLFMQRALGR